RGGAARDVGGEIEERCPPSLYRYAQADEDVVQRAAAVGPADQRGRPKIHDWWWPAARAPGRPDRERERRDQQQHEPDFRLTRHARGGGRPASRTRGTSARRMAWRRTGGRTGVPRARPAWRGGCRRAAPRPRTRRGSWTGGTLAPRRDPGPAASR